MRRDRRRSYSSRSRSRSKSRSPSKSRSRIDRTPPRSARSTRSRTHSRRRYHSRPRRRGARKHRRRERSRSNDRNYRLRHRHSRSGYYAYRDVDRRGRSRRRRWRHDRRRSYSREWRRVRGSGRGRGRRRSVNSWDRNGNGYGNGNRRRRGGRRSGFSLSSVGSGSSSRSSKKDDTVGCYEGRAGNKLGKYAIVDELGQGTFGSVWRCAKEGEAPRFAVKVIRSIKRYTKSARVESTILERVNAHFEDEHRRNPDHERLCIRLFEHFTWKNHYCIVTEVLGISLYDVVKRNRYNGLHLRHVLRILKHLLNGLHFLHSICHIVHTDLKLENILLVDDQAMKQILERNERTGEHEQISEDFNRMIRIIDFGGACIMKPGEPLQDAVINTRQYRSPEVTLEVGWGYPSDIWSAGCIAMEMLTGDLLFQTHEEMEHLKLITKVMQQDFPYEIVNKSPRKKEFFVSGTNRLAWPQKARDRESEHHVKCARVLSKTVRKAAKASEEKEKYEFLSLLQGMLQIDQVKRLTAAKALQQESMQDLDLCFREKARVDERGSNAHE